MAAPNIPTNFNVQQGNGQVFLSWDITVAATLYNIDRSTNGVTFSTIDTVSTNYYLDSTVTVGTNYYYQISAVGVSGTSASTTAKSIVPTYSGQLSLGQVRLMAQQRSDMVNSNFITLTEWNSYINQSYFELYDLLVTTYEDYYVYGPLQITTTGDNLYPLPNGVLYSSAPPLYKLLGVDIGIAGNSNAMVTVHKFDFISRNRYVYPQLTSSYLGIFNIQYRIVGSNIMFIPTPSANQTIQLWYAPRMTQLLQDIDILDGVSGWTEYVVIDAAIKAMQKQDFDVSVLAAEKMMMIKRIEESAMNRDMGQPDTISDTRSVSNSWGYLGQDGGWAGY